MSRIVVALTVFVWIGCAARSQAQDPLFVRASPVIVGRRSGEVMLVDVNRDGHLDLLTRHLLSKRVVVRLCDGRGHFASASGNAMSFGYQPASAALGDVNADGTLDLAVASRDDESEKVSIFLGNGRGGFAQASGSRVAVLLGDGRGFVSAPGSPFPVGRGAYYLAVGDVNEDGRLDIAAASFEGDAVTLLFGRGSRKQTRLHAKACCTRVRNPRPFAAGTPTMRPDPRASRHRPPR